MRKRLGRFLFCFFGWHDWEVDLLASGGGRLAYRCTLCCVSKYVTR